MGRINATACYRELGSELRKRRESAGVTCAQVAYETGWDRSKVSRVESGHVGVSVIDVIAYLGACKIYLVNAKNEIALCEIAESNPGYWLSPKGEWLEGSLASLIYHEATADRTIWYQPFTVPGLLQTPAYAREKIARGEARMSRSVDQALKIRMDRRETLNRWNPAQFVFFVHEQALRSLVGNAAVMHEQLLHVVLMAALGHVSLRIIPATVDQSKFGGPFQLFEYREHNPLLYLDSFLTGMFVEDQDYLGDCYRYLVPELKASALNEGESREYVASLADEYDRGSALDVGVAEEQLQ